MGRLSEGGMKASWSSAMFSGFFFCFWRRRRDAAMFADLCNIWLLTRCVKRESSFPLFSQLRPSHLFSSIEFFFWVCVFAAQLNLKRLMDSSTKRRSLCLEIYRQGRLLMSRRLPALMLCVLNQQAKLQRKPTTKGRLNGSLIREEKYKWRRCFIVIVTFWTWSSAYCLPATVGAKCAVWMTWSWKSISRPLK